MTHSDDGARARIQSELDTTFVVEAAAGTGKTTALVGRIAALIRQGVTRLDRVVAMTFTDKAAGELKLRLRSRFETEMAADEGGRVAAAMAALETAHITTIHAFCGELLREYPLAAGVDPSFTVVGDDASLLERAFDGWYRAALADPPPATRRVLRRSERPRAVLLGAVRALAEHRDFPAWWGRDADFDRDAWIDRLLADARGLGHIAATAHNPRDALVRELREITSAVAAAAPDRDRLEHALGRLAYKRSRRRPGRGEVAPGLSGADVCARLDAFFAELTRFAHASQADLAALLQRELAPVVAAHQALKARTGVLDYLDLLTCTRDLLRDDAAVRRALQARFSHVFLDEVQDTDPLQAEIVLRLVDEAQAEDWRDARPGAGRLFVVGDPQQAIYRFRRADLSRYQALKEQLVAGGAEVLRLTTSFRAVPRLQQAINHAFAPVMPDYAPLAPARDDEPSQPAFVALPVPTPYNPSSGWMKREYIEASTVEAVAAFVAWLVRDSGWTVSEIGGARVPVAPRHICLLFRRFRDRGADVTHPYVRALEHRRVPHVIAGGQAFHQREEVMALRTAMAAIEWPNDELGVYAALRGPFFSFSDVEIHEQRLAHGPLDPIAALETGQTGAIGQALAWLAKLHRARNQRPLAATLGALLRGTRAPAALAFWPSGEQVLANTMHVLELARRFEHGGATSFRAFHDHLVEQAERGVAADSAALEEGVDGVRLMTVHKAKGLEMPVVILCDADHRPWLRPSRYVDGDLWAFPLAGCVPAELRAHEAETVAADADEERRIVYVAATRARDLLVVPAVGDAPREGWVDVLHRSLYPPSRREAEPSPGCPAFGDDSVADRSGRVEATASASVKPGRHRFAGLDVTWWDPRVLALDVSAEPGLRQTELLAGDDGGAGAEIHARWLVEGERVRKTAARQRHDVWPLRRQLVEGEAPKVDVDELDSGVDRTGRPTGARFAALVRSLMAHVTLPDGDDVPPLATALGRTLGATGHERRAAIDAVRAALALPLMQRAAGVEHHRPLPVAHRRDDRWIEGHAELAFVADGIWTVVAIETDGAHERRERQRQRVALLCEAVAAATSAPCRGVVMLL